MSKEVAEYVSDARRNPSGSTMKRLRGEAVRKDGQPSVYNCEKWEYLLHAPFVISAKCCAIMKKSPLKTYEHKTEQQATTATMAEESRSRLIEKPLHCTGCQRTGCMFCAFGAHLEKGENRFERMKHTHPKHYDFCIGGGEWDTDGLWKPNEKGLGYGRVLDYIGVRY